MKGDNAGFYAIGTLAIVLLFFGMRSFDGNGNFTVGRGSGIKPPAVLIDPGGTRELFIEPSPGGSYETEVRLNGENIDMLVDTGASFVTIRQSDANRAGLIVSEQDFRHRFSTANGEVFAAQTIAKSLAIGPAVLNDVTIFVLPDDKLGIGLLGMNALNRFGRMEMTDSGLRLRVE
ncbi:MAG: TIGR02281 family clan AA aspartic protease [Pseudomonadota bacterium]